MTELADFRELFRCYLNSDRLLCLNYFFSKCLTEKEGISAGGADDLSLFNPLTAGAAYIRVFIFY